jgi:hypothetical protein
MQLQLHKLAKRWASPETRYSRTRSCSLQHKDALFRCAHARSFEILARATPNADFRDYHNHVQPMRAQLRSANLSVRSSSYVMDT